MLIVLTASILLGLGGTLFAQTDELPWQLDAQLQPTADSKSFLWEVRSPTTHVYLLGSVHLANKTLYPLKPTIMQAYNSSETLVVEADTKSIDKSQVNKLTQKYGMYQKGTDLQKEIPKELYQQLDAKLLKINMQAEYFKTMKPWLVGLTYTMLSFSLQRLHDSERERFSQSYGIDEYFLRQARGKKPIEELESAEFQIKLLGSMPKNEQILFLEYSLDGKSQLDMTKLMTIWKEGDIPSLEKMLFRALQANKKYEFIYEKLFWKRNRSMSEKIEGYLTGKKVYFIVVGAGHLVGKDSIIDILQKKKYKIKRL